MARADGSAGHGTGRAAALLAARPLVAARHPPALARRRVSPRRRRRRPARRSQRQTGSPGPGNGRRGGPLRYARRPHRSSSRATRSTSTARGSARCARWSAWWPTRSGSRSAAFIIRNRSTRPTTLQIVGNAKQNIQADDQIGARPPVALPHASRATARCPARSARGLPGRLQALRKPGGHPPRRVRRVGNGVPRPRLQRGHRLVAHPGRAGHSRTPGRHGGREIRRRQVRLHGHHAAGQAEAAAGQGGLDARSPSRAKRSISRSASTTSAIKRSAT